MEEAYVRAVENWLDSGYILVSNQRQCEARAQ